MSTDNKESKTEVCEFNWKELCPWDACNNSIVPPHLQIPIVRKCGKAICGNHYMLHFMTSCKICGIETKKAITETVIKLSDDK